MGLPDGRTLSAAIVGRDPGTDLALLRVEGADPTPVERGGAPRWGNLILLVARPGAGLATSIGVVSALGGPGRTRWGGTLEGTIRTDATFFPGFSGGAMVDTAGRLLGLATSYRGWDYGLGIPLETVERVTRALTSHGRIKRGYLGLTSQPVAIPSRCASVWGWSRSAGCSSSASRTGAPPTAADSSWATSWWPSTGSRCGTRTTCWRRSGRSESVRETAARVVRGGEPRDLSVAVGERP